MAGSLSLFFDCIRSDVGNVTSIPTDDGGEPSGKGSGPGEGDAKVESGSNAGNGLSIPTGGSVVESIDSYDELSSLSWKSSGEGGIRRRVRVSRG